MLGAEGQRFAIRLAVVEKLALVTLQNRLGDGARVVERALGAPADEAPECHAAGAHGVCGIAVREHPVQVCVHVSRERLRSERIDRTRTKADRLYRLRLAMFDALSLARHG